MNVATMLTNLGNYLDDTDAERYTTAIKLAAINEEYANICGSVNTDLLRDLHGSTNFTAGASGNTLPTDYFRYAASKLYNVEPEKWIVRTELENISVYQDNQYSAGSDIDPLCYIWGNTIYIILDDSTYGDTEANVTLYYIQSPSALGSTDTIPIDVSLHRNLLKLAESNLKQTYKYGDLAEAIKMYEDNWNAVMQVSAKHSRKIIL